MKNNKILFIGNSFTYYNDMPSAIFAPMLKGAGICAEVYSVTKGGWSLSKFVDPTDEYGVEIRKMLAEHKFDAVVLQEQSHTPVSDPESFFSAVEALHKMIEENGARTYLYATWGYSALHPKLSLYGADTLDMEKRLRDSYMKIAKRLGITVCQVGAAMSYAYLHGVTGLYKEDHYHPDACGSLIAAAVIFEGLFGNEPSIADVGGVSLSCDGIKAVREALAFAREVH